MSTRTTSLCAKGLAKEIIGKKPDLVGLQELALWRTNDTASLGPAVGGPFTATTVKYDFLKLLMDRLNAGKQRYRIVKVQKEFDFEAPADYNNQPNDADPGVAAVMPDAEMNGRLTMRDAILARVGAGVVTKNAKGGNFKTIYKPVISGVEVKVNRGWVRTDVSVRGSRRFRFVDTHLEAFGDTDIRKAQAEELVAPGGPATGKLPVVLVGDLNSDDSTGEQRRPDAYNALKGKGFVDRSTENPMSCCLKSDILTADKGSAEGLRSPHRSRPHQPPRQGERDLLRRLTRAGARERLLGLRPRRRLQRAEDPPLERSRPQSRAKPVPFSQGGGLRRA